MEFGLCSGRLSRRYEFRNQSIQRILLTYSRVLLHLLIVLKHSRVLQPSIVTEDADGRDGCCSTIFLGRAEPFSTV